MGDAREVPPKACIQLASVTNIEQVTVSRGGDIISPALHVDTTAKRRECQPSVRCRVPRTDDDCSRVANIPVKDTAAAWIIEIHVAIACRFNHHDAERGRCRDGIKHRLMPFNRATPLLGVVADAAARVGLLLDQNRIAWLQHASGESDRSSRVIAMLHCIGGRHEECGGRNNTANAIGIRSAAEHTQHGSAMVRVIKRITQRCLGVDIRRCVEAEILVIQNPAILDIYDRR